MNLAITKDCLDCKETKPVDGGFNKNCRKPDGYDIYCKTCCRARSAASWAKRRARDPGYSTRKSREFRARNPDAVRAYAVAWLKANPEKRKAYYQEFYAKHRVRLLAQDKAAREANIEKFLERERASLEKRKERKEITARLWREANPHKIAKTAALRRARIARRTPKWLTVDDFEMIDAIYECAQWMTKSTGTPHHVDHEIPLKGRLVSGLHVPSNLQVLPATDNLKKNNSWSVE